MINYIKYWENNQENLFPQLSS